MSVVAVPLPRGAELVLIDGMGHNLPPAPLWNRLADRIVAVVRRGEAVRAATRH